MINNKVVWLDDEPSTIKAIVMSFIESSGSRYQNEVIQDAEEMFSLVEGMSKDEGFVVVDVNIGDGSVSGGLKLAKRLGDSGVQFIVISATVPTHEQLKSLIKCKNFINFFSKNSPPDLLGFQINASMATAIQRRKYERALSKMEVLAAASGALVQMKGVTLVEAKRYHRDMARKKGVSIEDWSRGFVKRFSLDIEL